MNNSMKLGSVKAITLFSILIVLSGMAAIASADDVPQAPNMFYGTVTLNEANASSGTVIDAYIDEELCGSVVIDTEGMYYDLGVESNESGDGKTVTFTVCGATAEQTAVWHAGTLPTMQELNLTAVDNVAPAVTNASANPPSIIADGANATQLTVTVIDGCTVGIVTVDLSAIGGDYAQEMTRIGDTDVYSMTVTASESTLADTYCLQVNASDVFGNYEDGVCIDLVVEAVVVLDEEAPVVTNPDANPASIVADGTQESQLTVTVVDDSDIDFVTVDLSAIGGDEVQEMTRIGDTDVYSMTVTASESTLADTYCLQVNASDVFGNYEDGVCITIVVTPTGLPQTGDMDGDGDIDFDDALYLARYTIFGEIMYPLHADGNVDSINGVTFDDALYLARHTIFGEGTYPLYP